MIFTETSSINAYDLFYVTAVHVEDIIFHMFQYIQKLRTEGPQEWVFDECKVIIVVYLSIEVEVMEQREPRETVMNSNMPVFIYFIFSSSHLIIDPSNVCLRKNNNDTIKFCAFPLYRIWFYMCILFSSLYFTVSCVCILSHDFFLILSL